MEQEQTQPEPENLTADLLNVPERVKAFNQEYEIKRFNIGQLMRAGEHIAPLGYLVQFASQADIGGLLTEALTSAGKPALGLLSVAIEQPVEWFDDKDPIEAYELLAAVVEKNVRYFFDCKQRIDVATARIKKAIPEKVIPLSGELSTLSSAADTAH